MSLPDFAISTPEALARHARLTPDRVSVVDQGQSITYGHFHEDVLKTATALESFAITAGDIVAIAFDGLYRPWLLQLACEYLGAATIHFDPGPLAEGVKAILDQTAMTFFNGKAPGPHPGHHADDA